MPNLFNFVSVETIIYVLIAAVLVLALFLTVKKYVYKMDRTLTGLVSCIAIIISIAMIG